jgi:hypothetical protein
VHPYYHPGLRARALPASGPRRPRRPRRQGLSEVEVTTCPGFRGTCDAQSRKATTCSGASFRLVPNTSERATHARSGPSGRQATARHAHSPRAWPRSACTLPGALHHRSGLERSRIGWREVNDPAKASVRGLFSLQLGDFAFANSRRGRMDDSPAKPHGVEVHMKGSLRAVGL